MDILNFISWIKAGKYSTTAPDDAITVVGVPNPTRGDAYLPVTVPISALQTNIGKLMGGGIVVSEWIENGVHKALVASLTNLSTTLPYTITAFQSTLIGATAQSYSNGLTNTNAIIAQTGAAANTTYAAGLARLFAAGGYSDWYLPALYELHILYNSAAITNRISGVTAFDTTISYFSSTEQTATQCYGFNFATGNTTANYGKSFGGITRAVRIHTI